MDETLVSKSQFAKLYGVTPGRVTRWISAGQLTGDALVGTGRSALICVSAARKQLKRKLDPVRAKRPLDEADGEDNELSLQIKRSRLEALQHTNRKLAEEAAARAGRYVLAVDVAQQMGRIAGQMVSTFDVALADMAAAVAARFALNQREVLHLLRAEFRAIRTRAAAAWRGAADALPVLVEDDQRAEE